MGKKSFHDQVAELVALAALYARDGELKIAADRLRSAAAVYDRQDAFHEYAARQLIAKMESE